MPSIDELRARVTRAARTVLDLGDTEVMPTDDEGDLTVPWGNSIAHLRIVDGDPPLLTVFSVVLAAVPRSADLLGALNDMNAGIVSCRVFWADQNVIAASDVPVNDLQPQELEHALWAVGSFADWADTELQPRFGGRLGRA